MNRPVLTLLLVEDFSVDRELYRRCLVEDAIYSYRFVEAESASEGLELCRTQAIDAIVLDYSLPDANGLEFLESLRVCNPQHPPVLMVTGQGDETIAVRAIKLGAEDYIVKRQLTPKLLQLGVHSAIENTRLRQQLRQSEERLQASEERWQLVMAANQDGMWDMALPSGQAVVSTRLEEIFGCTPGSITNFSQFLSLVHPDDLTHLQLTWQQHLDRKTDLYSCEYRVRCADGSYKWILCRGQALWDDRGKPVRAIGSVTDITASKQQAETIERQLAEIESIYASAPVGLCYHDRELRFVRINDRLAQMHGLPAAEHIGRTMREILPPEMADTIEPLHRQVLATGEPMLDLQVCGTLPTQPGVLRYWTVCYYPQKDSQQQVVGINVTVQEITTLKDNERRLQESQTRLELGVRVAGIALARFDYATNTVALSAEAARAYGLGDSATTVAREQFRATFHPDDRHMMERAIESILDPTSNGWFEREHRVVWPNGEVRWLNVRKQVFFNRSGATPKADYAMLAAIDITERRRIEEIVRQSEERYRYLSGLIPQLVWIAQPDGMLLDVNDRWVEYTGLTLARAQIGGWQEIVHPEDIATLSSAWEAAQRNGTRYQAEGRVRRADGIYRWHLHQAMPQTDERGQIVCWFGTAIDIHDIKEISAERDRLLAEAQAARAEAEAANRSKDEFVAVIAHELRSPLNSIAGWAKLLQNRTFDAATQTKALETIWRNTQTQVQLVEDLLDISRMVRGNLQLTLDTVNLATVTRSAIDLVSPQAHAKQIQIDTHLCSHSQVSGDTQRLQQIVVNLLTNAIKFTPEGGTIEIALDGTGERRVRLQVSDTGKGIAATVLPYIFERFHQGQKNTGSQDGLGLGLAIVKYLVELHHGTIVAHSEGVGRGATFSVELPLLGAPPLSPTTAMSEEEATLAGVQILTVDDEPDMLDLIGFILEESGAEVRTAENITSALDVLTQFKPDLIISDIAMPGGNGYELLARIQQLYTEKIPAIALTAYASTTHEERSLQAGFDRHLTKPFDPELLVKISASLVRRG